MRFCAAPEIATAILPPNWREEGGPLVAGAGLGGPVAGAVAAAREARDPEEIEAATRSRSTPGGVDPAPTFTRSLVSVKVGDMKEAQTSFENAIGMEMKGLTITAVRGKGPTTWGPGIGKG